MDRRRRAQLICVWVGTAAFVAIGLFPPWIIGAQTADEIIRRPAGHHFIAYKGPGELLAMDYGHLVVEWFLIALVVGAVIVSFQVGKGRGENG